jgi:hypothetical protein
MFNDLKDFRFAGHAYALTLKSIIFTKIINKFNFYIDIINLYIYNFNIKNENR